MIMMADEQGNDAMKVKNALILITSTHAQLSSTLAMHFSTLGASVIICDSSGDNLASNNNIEPSSNGNIEYYSLPDHSPESIKRLFDDIEENYQSAPDVLINHWPIIAFPSLIEEQATDRFILQLTNMAASLFSFGQTCSEKMRQYQSQGVIINVVWQNSAQHAGIETTNSIVLGLTQSWANELTPYNIRVAGVIPLVNDNNESLHWAQIQDELIRNTEYIVANDYFSGRVIAA